VFFLDQSIEIIVRNMLAIVRCSGKWFGLPAKGLLVTKSLYLNTRHIPSHLNSNKAELSAFEEDDLDQEQHQILAG